MLQGLGAGGPWSQMRRGQRFSWWETLEGVPKDTGWHGSVGGHPFSLPPHPSAPSPTSDGNWEAKVCPEVKKLIIFREREEGHCGEVGRGGRSPLSSSVGWGPYRVGWTAARTVPPPF